MRQDEINKAAEKHAQSFSDIGLKSIDATAFIDGARYMAAAIYNSMTEQTEVGKDLCEQGIEIYYKLEELLTSQQ